MKNRTTSIVVASALVTFVVFSSAVVAGDYKVDQPEPLDVDSYVAVLEDGFILHFGAEIDSNEEEIPYYELADEQCAFAAEQVNLSGNKLLQSGLITTASSTSANVETLLPGESPAPYDSDAEEDAMPTGACRELRDAALSFAWDTLPTPVVQETCSAQRGIQTCVAIKHWQCDVGFLTYYNQVSLCIGGIFPDN